jgi:hypothetical protein
MGYRRSVVRSSGAAKGGKGLKVVTPATNTEEGAERAKEEWAEMKKQGSIEIAEPLSFPPSSVDREQEKQEERGNFNASFFTGHSSRSKLASAPPLFDILALGFQELDLSTEGMIWSSTASVMKAKVWEEGVERVLNSQYLDKGELQKGEKYVRVC